MFENYVIVARKKSIGKRIAAILLLVAMFLLFFLGTVISPYIFEIPGLACGIGWYLLTFKSYLEYEYSYFDGELKITKIKNKGKRKRLKIIDMAKVIIMAPKGSRSVHHYEEDRQLQHLDYTSGMSGDNIYELVYSSEEGITMISFEPDEKMIDAMRMKYSKIVMK